MFLLRGRGGRVLGRLALGAGRVVRDGGVVLRRRVVRGPAVGVLRSGVVRARLGREGPRGRLGGGVGTVCGLCALWGVLGGLTGAGSVL